MDFELIGLNLDFCLFWKCLGKNLPFFIQIVSNESKTQTSDFFYKYPQVKQK